MLNCYCDVAELLRADLRSIEYLPYLWAKKRAGQACIEINDMEYESSINARQ